MSGFCAQAQQYNFISYNIDEGLPQSQVTCINQDAFGYLWVGTQIGLSKFDGVDFQNFSITDNLTDNKIEDVLIDGYYVWAVTSKGISYSEGNQPFIPLYFNEPYRVNDLAKSGDDLLIATDDGVIFLKNKKEFIYPKKDSLSIKIRSIEEVSKTLYCGTSHGLFYLDNSELQPIPKLDSLDWNISDMAQSGDTLYISTVYSGVWKYHPASGEVALLSNTLPKTRQIFASKSNVLVATRNGLIIHSGKGELLLNNKNGLVSQDLKCSFEDFEGNIWIGTDGGGLLKYSGDALISFGVSDGLSSNAVMAIGELDNEYLFGTYNAGLTILKGKKTATFQEENGFIDKRVWGVHVFNEVAYFVTDQGLSSYDGEAFKIHSSSLIQHKLKSITNLDSTLYIGGVRGVFKVDGEIAEQVAGTEGLNVNRLITRGDEILVGCNSGLFRITQSGEVIQVLLPENDVNTLMIDEEDNLWIGTTNGLFVMRDGAIIEIILNNEEFKSRYTLGLLQGKDKKIWVTTNYGVYSIAINNSQNIQGEIRAYGKVEGLINMECNLNALYQDEQDYIWIGTSTGLCRVDPSKTDKLFLAKEPRIWFTGIRLFLEAFNFEKYTKATDPLTHLPKQLVLPYNKNHLTFDFIGINLSNPKSVKYTYRMIGLDDDWAPLQQDNYATYSFISPGNYTFELKAANKSMDWSKSISIQLTILSPFWLTWWFTLLMGLIGLGIVLLIFRIRIRSIKQRQENEKLAYKNRLQILEQRSLNASMNRHFIFNSLNSIQYYINSSDKRSANKYLTSFAKLIRMNLDSSVQNNFIIPLQEEIERIEIYLNLEKMRFKEKFDYQLEIDPDLDVESIEIPSMILQPFVENALIHGILPLDRKGNITISIFEELNHIVFQVFDDGVGIDKSLENKKDLGGGDHESQGVDITNRRIELLRRITGDQLMIIGPYQRNNENGDCLGTNVIIKMPMNISHNF